MVALCLDRTVTVIVEVKRNWVFLVHNRLTALISALGHPSGIPCLLLDVSGSSGGTCEKEIPG